ncbi:MAG: PD-(D/E)XK nuclease family protein [Candidatus Accumulibacter sp.]|jgi:hypothetical protein|nr:PD-(D/E)XK nuclease family protein [Accumulibacter sp.]
MINTLLEDVSKISGKYDSQYQASGSRFNFFEAGGIERKEAVVCRFLRELLDPKGSHSQGITYLKLFLRDILKIEEIPDEDISIAEVINEYTIDGNRRIDIAIRISSYFIPIEVKIDAGDQYEQVRDYYDYAVKRSRKTGDKINLFYLTLYGTSPSPESAKGLTKEIVNISFAEHIRKWLYSCLEKTPEKAYDLRVPLCQFAKSIQKITNIWEEPESMEIMEYITANKEIREAAIKIKDAVESAKRLIARELYESFMKVLPDGNDVPWGGGLLFEIQYPVDNSVLCDNYKLCFILHQDTTSENISYGFIIKNGKNEQVRANNGTVDRPVLEELLKKCRNIFPHEKGFGEKFEEYGIWKKLPGPNFMNVNNACLELHDDDVRKRFVEESIREINAVLDEYGERLGFRLKPRAEPHSSAASTQDPSLPQ